MDALTTVGLTKVYGGMASRVHRPGGHVAGEVRALENLTIAVREGEIFGFLGPNGAGKSTTIRLLLGFLHPSLGSGSVLGLDIGRDSESGRLPPGRDRPVRLAERRGPARLPRRAHRAGVDAARRAPRTARA